METRVFKRKVKISDRVFRVLDGPSYEKQEAKQKSISRDQMTPKSDHDQGTSYGLVFWISVAMSQVIGVISIVITIHWGNLYGGLSVEDKDLLFNYHPLFMILGLVVFFGDSIIVYRALSFLPKFFLKIIHAALHLFAIVFSSLGLVAVFENHRRTDKPDLYSLHSWVGIAAFGAFCLQYIGSFVTFLFPGLPPNWRAKVMPIHTFMGIGLFAVAVGTAEMGITEKLLYTPNYSSLIPKGLTGNSLGLLILVFAFLIIYIASHSTYKRKPLPSEMPSPSPLNRSSHL